MAQKNSVYEHPEMEVVKLETAPLLSGSTGATGTGEDMNIGGGSRNMFYEEEY